MNKFHKRKLALIRKAMGLATLCSCNVTVVIEPPRTNDTEGYEKKRFLAFSSRPVKDVLDDCMASNNVKLWTPKDMDRFPPPPPQGGRGGERTKLLLDGEMHAVVKRASMQRISDLSD
jgi:hypothetical protein